MNKWRGLFHTTVGASLDVFKIGKHSHLTLVFLGVIACSFISISSPSMGSSLFLVDLHRRSKRITTPVAMIINTRPLVAENGTTYHAVFFAIFPTCTGEKQNCSQYQSLESVPAFLSLTCDQAIFFGDSAKQKGRRLTWSQVNLSFAIHLIWLSLEDEQTKNQNDQLGSRAASNITI